MHIHLSPKQKISFLVVACATGTAVMAAFFTKIISGRQTMSEKTLLEWMFLPEVVFSSLAVIAVFIFSYLRLNRKISELIDETLESLASGVLCFERDGRVARFNPAAAAMLPELAEEESSENYIGTYKKFLAFIYDRSLDIQDQSKLALDISQMDQSRLLFREVAQFKNGRVALVQFYQRVSTEIVAVITDISMMKNHIEEVSAASEENRIMVKAIESAGNSMMIARCTQGGAPVIFANELFAASVKTKRENIIGRQFNEILQETFEDQTHTIQNAIASARRDGAAGNIWLKFHQEKKNILWYSFHLLFFSDSDDREFFVCFLSDQTQVRLAQAKTYQTQKLEAVAQLAGGIAHDFNNILSVIDGYSKIIKRSLDKGSDISPFLEVIDRSVKRGTQITGRLLTIGQCRITQKVRFDLCEQVRDAEPLLTSGLSSSINLIMSIQETPCYVESAPDAVTQIVLSLADNAKDAMPQGGDLIISAADASRSQILSFQEIVDCDEDYICLQVIDSGHGMNAETLGRIYEPFFTTRDPGKSSGLGLSLVHGLVKECEGLIDVRSTPGVGTSVSILIPRKAAPEHVLFEPQDQSRTYREMT